MAREKSLHEILCKIDVYVLWILIMDLRVRVVIRDMLTRGAHIEVQIYLFLFSFIFSHGRAFHIKSNVQRSAVAYLAK